MERIYVTAESLIKHLPGCDETVSNLLDIIFASSLSESVQPIGVEIPEAERKRVLSLLLRESDGRSEDEEGTRTTLTGAVLQHEFVITCRRKDFKGNEEHLCHRFYFKDAVNEVRLASVLVSEL